MKKTGDEYFDSEEFRELLSSYEDSVSSGQPIFLDADELTDIADYYHFTCELEKAEEVIEKALDFYPGATAPLVYKVHEALAREDVEEAKELAEQITDKNAADYFYLQAELLIAQDKTEEADQYLRDYYKTVPADEHEDFVTDAANIWLDYGVYDKAYEWVMRYPGNDSPDFKELTGRIMFGLGKYKESQRTFMELIDNDPYSGRYWNALASAQFMNEDYSDSITSSEYAIAIDPTDGEALLNKANGLYRLNNFEEALKYYLRYNEYMPSIDFTELQAGICLLYLNRTGEAVKHLQKARQLTFDGSEYQVQVYQELAFTYSALGKVDEAMKCIDQTKDMDCDHDDMEVLRGHILLQNQCTDKAEDAFRRAVTHSKNAPHILLRIIVSLFDNKLNEAAYVMFGKFFSLVGDDYDEGYSYMALCCWELNKKDEFLKFLKLAVEHNPGEARIVLNTLFPEGMNPKDYYQYMLDNCQAG
ncbi:MAG: tetratricopeptide repeat protein [Prevotella sp.]|nr:tetratricopeptide repeat protein [Prevotella sp.]